MRNIAIFGGTFNPIHWGHLVMAETALAQFSLDLILWVPTAHPPHKPGTAVSLDHRLAMLHCATADHPAFRVAAVEADSPGTSYAIDTLRTLKQQYPAVQWHWLIGSDAFQSLPAWRGADELACTCTWLVALRAATGLPDEDTTRLSQSAIGPSQSPSQPALGSASPERTAAYFTTRAMALRWHRLQMPCVGISSSLVRQQCQQRQSIRYLVPESVRSYISDKNLYQMS